MITRLYISKLIGAGTKGNPITWTDATGPWRPAWYGILSASPPLDGHCIEAKRYRFWIGQLATTDEDHTLLVADPRIRYIPRELLSTTLANLTVPQRNAIIEVCTWLGVPTNIWDKTNTRVADLLFYIMGRATWHPISQAADA